MRDFKDPDIHFYQENVSERYRAYLVSRNFLSMSDTSPPPFDFSSLSGA